MNNITQKLVNPLLIRKVRSNAEKSLISKTCTSGLYDPNAETIHDVVAAIKLKIDEDYLELIKKTIDETFDATKCALIDIYYMVMFSVKQISNNNKPLYKIKVSIGEYTKFRNFLNAKIS